MGHAAGVSALAISTDCGCLVSGDEGGAVAVWALALPLATTAPAPAGGGQQRPGSPPNAARKWHQVAPCHLSRPHEGAVRGLCFLSTASASAGDGGASPALNMATVVAAVTWRRAAVSRVAGGGRSTDAAGGGGGCASAAAALRSEAAAHFASCGSDGQLLLWQTATMQVRGPAWWPLASGRHVKGLAAAAERSCRHTPPPPPASHH